MATTAAAVALFRGVAGVGRGLVSREASLVRASPPATGWRPHGRSVSPASIRQGATTWGRQKTAASGTEAGPGSESVTEDALLAAAAYLAGSGVPPVAVEAFSNSGPPCSLRCVISGISGGEVNDIADLLLSFGATSATIAEERAEGREEQEIFHDGKWDSRELWDHCKITALFPVEHDAEETLRTVESIIGRDEHFQVVMEEVLDEEWEKAIKDSYIPFEVQEGLWVVPAWCESPEPSATNLLLEPGLAFGTGEHPTTRLCLICLRQHIKGGEAVMDYGTGSGVLAIGALKFGASEAAGTDVDRLSVVASARNAALNGMADTFSVFRCGADLSEPEPLAKANHSCLKFDVVVANILRGPLTELRPRLLGYLKPGGRIILSGVTKEQAQVVAEDYGKHLQESTVEIATLGSWGCITGVSPL